MPYNIIELLECASTRKASDLHITVGLPPMFRINGQLVKAGDEILLPDQTAQLISEITDKKVWNTIESEGQADYSYAIQGCGRFRINTYKQRKSVSSAIRIIRSNSPTLDELYMPQILKSMVLRNNGLFLVTGPTGSGKSTTLAAMVDHINKNKNCHVITIEDPIEYLHKHGKAMINQREIGDDTNSFANALRAALREDPDVILLGEMRDLETISTAVTAAETGHYVMSTLHTTSTASTIDRIIDVFPPYQQEQIRIQLAASLQGILSQQLLPTADGKSRIAAVELLIANDAIKNLIREGKTHQIDTVIQTNIKAGMKPMDFSLSQLVKEGKITHADAVAHCLNIKLFNQYMELI